MKRSAPRRGPQSPGVASGYTEARKAVYARARGLCECCGRRLTLADMHFHHRKARKHGRDDSAANGLGMCWACHAGVHANPSRSRLRGWIVPSWGDPYTTPVVLRDGVWWLRADGSRDPVARGAHPMHPLPAHLDGHGMMEGRDHPRKGNET